MRQAINELGCKETQPGETKGIQMGKIGRDQIKLHEAKREKHRRDCFQAYANLCKLFL